VTEQQRTFRALGGVDQGSLPPAGEVADALRAEFDRVFTLKASLRGEAEAGVSPTGRRTTAQDEAKLRTLVASVEGASRFAIRLRLLTAGQVRALWAEAMGKGLYDGWDAGQSAYGHAAEPDAQATGPASSGALPEVLRGDAPVDRPEGSGEPRRGAPVDRPEGSGEPRRGAPVDQEGDA
jgi:hypothetical protein